MLLARLKDGASPASLESVVDVHGERRRFGVLRQRRPDSVDRGVAAAGDADSKLAVFEKLLA